MALGKMNALRIGYLPNFGIIYPIIRILIMKKTLIYAGAAFLLFGTSCKETLIPVVPATVDTTTTDSTYIGNIESPDTRNVYIEEFTGVQCVNCPTGAIIIEGMIASHSNIISISQHTSANSSYPFNQPIPGKSIQDFRTNDGEAMVQQLFDNTINNKPVSVFDRAPLVSDGTMYFTGSTGWLGAYTTDIDKYGDKAPVNVSVSSKYNAATARYEITTTIKYTATATTDQYALNLYLTEEGVVDVQELSDKSLDVNYLFHHVFRKAITGTGNGVKILPDVASKPAGTVYIYHNSFAINPDAKTYGGSAGKNVEGMWNPDNMDVTAVITLNNSGSTDKHVVQAVRTKLKGS